MEGDTSSTVQAAPGSQSTSTTATTNGGFPPGIVPLYLTFDTQEQFHLLVDEDVTEAFPWKLIPKADILADIKKKEISSDFEGSKEKIEAFHGPDIMLVYDKAQKYGQNFYMCVLPETFNEELERKRIAENPNAENAQQQHTTTGRTGWISQGSEKEIEAMYIKTNRPLLKINFSRPRREFGKPTKFSETEDIDSQISLTSFTDPNFQLRRAERDFGVQAAIEMKTSSVQTPWFRKVNSAIQCGPEIMKEDEERLQSQKRGGMPKRDTSIEVNEFLHSVLPRVEQALRQNETVQIFKDDFSELLKEDIFVGRKSENFLKEYQSFTHIQYSKNKKIAAMDWQPKARGIVAVSCIEPVGFEERVRRIGKTMTSHVILWNFNDPIHPQIVLEAPFDVTCLRFNPTQPNLIAGGCINGQVVLWDIGAAQLDLKRDSSSDASDDKPEGHQIPKIKWTKLSTIENGHRRAVNDLQWMPDAQEMLIDGTIRDTLDVLTYQFFTISSDGQLLLWDIRKRVPSSRRGKKPAGATDKDDVSSLNGSPWVPFHRLHLMQLDGTSEIGGCQLSLDGKSDPYKLCCTSQEGEFVVADWSAHAKIVDEKIAAAVGGGAPAGGNIVKEVIKGHHGPGLSIHRNPSDKNILLTVGDWSFKLWRLGLNKPLLASPFKKQFVTCGRWSPTRPAVFYIGTSDGQIEIWDLLDKSHEPSISQRVTSVAITCIEFRAPSHGKSKYSVQFIAIGDEAGTLNIMEVPPNLIRPVKNEVALVTKFFDQETARVKYFQKRWEVRKKEYEELQEQMKREKLEAELKKDENTREKENEENEKELAAQEKEFLELIQKASAEIEKQQQQ